MSAVGGDAVLLFIMPVQIKEAEYSVGGGALCWLWWKRKKGKLAQMLRKCN